MFTRVIATNRGSVCEAGVTIHKDPRRAAAAIAMPRDWPDPRDSRPVRRWEIWLAAALTALPLVALLSGLIK